MRLMRMDGTMYECIVRKIDKSPCSYKLRLSTRFVSNTRTTQKKRYYSMTARWALDNARNQTIIVKVT